MDAPLPLDHRKQQILKAVVADFTETGVPVGSQSLAAQLSSWSSATIRNDLATLVEVGYLLQPHTSAGRVPSQRGYRYYVDFLMREEPLPATVRRELDQGFADLPRALDDILEIAAQTLAKVTDGVSIVTGPQALDARVKHLDLVSLDATSALLMLVLEGNVIRQQAVPLSTEADQDQLSALAQQLRAELRGLDVEGVETLPVPAGPVDRLRQEVVDHVVRFMRLHGARQDTLVVHDGVRNLLRQPEFLDIERLHQVLEVVEEQRLLGTLLASLQPDGEMHVMIGTEAGLEQLRECSLVLSTYRAGNARYGTIGVLGPTRMRYPQVASRVRSVSLRTGQAITRLLG